MAWTCKADRFNAKSLKVVDTPDIIGPGTYTGHESINAIPSQAPFGSSDVRVTANDRASIAKDAGPPVGAYDPKLPAAYDAGLPRKTVPFQSGAPRADPANKSRVPGPGHNHREPALEILPCRTMGPPSEVGKKVMSKSATAPSIPRGPQCYGYDEAGDGRLVMQGPKDGKLYFTGQPENSAGPGQYDSHRVAVNVPRAAGGKFLGGAARQKHQCSEAPGPGHYVALKGNEMAVSSSFVSGSSQRPEKSRKKKNSTPGPGQYSRDLQSAPSLREQHPELQYFGSTSERFRSDEYVSGNPGPGSYIARQRVVLKSSWCASDRFSEPAKAQVTLEPGPGHYTPATTDGKTTGVLGTTSLLGSTGTLAFGSMESRLRQKAESGQAQPGPGAYELIEYDSVEQVKEDPRRRLARAPKRQPSESKPDMLGQQAPELQSSPPPGAYNPVHIQDTGTVMRLPPKGEGFLSGGPRLPRSLEKTPKPDPGDYKSDPALVTGGKRSGTFNRAVVEAAPENGRPKGLGFTSNARRFKKDGAVAGAPGPGAYTTASDWTKKNYNIHFGEI